MTNNGPLQGVRILDFTQLLPGPVCTQYLAELGAEVIKIEAPGRGDPARGPKGVSPLFLMVNRGKHSVELDLQSPAGRQQVLSLIEDADVLVEGFRPGTMARFGLDFESVKASNPALVYCSITGFGQTGPLAQSPGHDINYQSLSGVLEQNGGRGQSPVTGNFPVADLAGGSLTAATGILAALFDAHRTGMGRHVDIAMKDSLLALNLMATSALKSDPNTGEAVAVPRGEDYLSGGLACYQVYATADDRQLAVGAIEFKFWQNFCQVIERPDLLDKGHIGGEQGRQAIDQVKAVIKGKTLDQWQEAFNGIEACVTPVLTLPEVLSHPNTKARQLACTHTHASGIEYTFYPCPIRMSGFKPGYTQAPTLGADNHSILTSYGSEPLAV